MYFVFLVFIVLCDNDTGLGEVSCLKHMSVQNCLKYTSVKYYRVWSPFGEVNVEMKREKDAVLYDSQCSTATYKLNIVKN